jgi:23S rRNA pseudouridine2605 synthase
VVTGKSGSAISDPSRKPSRVRAAETATAQSIERANRPAKKAGWAKAAPPSPRGPSTKKAWVPREGAAPEGDRPKRVFKPREDQIIGPKSSSWARDAGRDDKPKRDFKPRGEGGARPSGTSGRPAGASTRPRGPAKPRG